MLTVALNGFSRVEILIVWSDANPRRHMSVEISMFCGMMLMLSTTCDVH